MSVHQDRGDYTDHWSAGDYSGKVAPFVAQLATKVVSWIEPEPTDDILDIGCGDGVLTAQLAPKVHSIVGIDSSANMLAAFRSSHPSISTHLVDCRHLLHEERLADAAFDKIFSNAALHWILRDPSTRRNTIAGCLRVLKPGGRFIAECGAMGNVAEAHSALIAALVHRGIDVERARQSSPWWFPSLSGMRSLLEGEGFEWIKGEVEMRQTELTSCDGGGFAGWVKLFGAEFLAVLPTEEDRNSAVSEVCSILESVGRRDVDGKPILNYIRLRFVVQKPR